MQNKEIFARMRSSIVSELYDRGVQVLKGFEWGKDVMFYQGYKVLLTPNIEIRKVAEHPAEDISNDYTQLRIMYDRICKKVGYIEESSGEKFA